MSPSRTSISPAAARRFEQVATPWLPMLVRTAQCLERGKQDADDLVQETLIKAACGIDGYTDGSDARAWLLTILRRSFVDRLRARKRRPDEVSLDEAATAADAATGVHDTQWSDPEDLLEQFSDEQVIDALKRLPMDWRWALLLVDVEQLTQEEAAQVLGTPVGTVKSRVHRARGALRDALHEWARSQGWLRQGVRK